MYSLPTTTRLLVVFFIPLAHAVCRLGFDVLDPWCSSFQNACTLPCLPDEEGQCRFAGKVQSWYDPCFYVHDASCIFPCSKSENEEDSSTSSHHSPPSPPPSLFYACHVLSSTPSLVYEWWHAECARLDADACAQAEYCSRE